VPASSANLGPGFDVLAAALGLHMELDVAEVGRFEVRTDLAIARDARNLAVRGFAALRPADRMRFTIRSDIPLSGGLGTSAAAYVAGLAAADALNGGGADLLAEATRLEGHPDNVAAALLGGFVVCAGGSAVRLDPPAGLEAVLVVPSRAVRTAKARAALPSEVPMGEAVFNVGRASLLVLGLARGDLDLVARGLEDRLHQPRRASLYPRSMELVERAAELGALGATISGAGPSVLVWARAENAGEVTARLEARASGWARVLRLPFAESGVEVRASGIEGGGASRLRPPGQRS
jgi:homoserine kinase